MTVQKSLQCFFTLGVVLLVGSAAAQSPKNHNTQQEAPATTATQAGPAATEAQAATAAAPAKQHQEAAETTDSQAQLSAINNWKDKLSYALGADLARKLRLQHINVNVDLLVQALRDSLANKELLLKDDEVVATLKRFEYERRQDLEHATRMRSDKNKKAGEAFFAENVKKEGVVTLPSGLQYVVLKQGDGKKPTIDDQVVCNYRGTLLDGTEFDSSYERNQPATLPVKRLIKGWAEALQLMPVGSKWKLFIPPQLAYGERVVGGIGPNAMLVFEVELLSIADKTETQAKETAKGASNGLAVP